MPGATLPNLSIILPSLGGDIGSWDDELNAALSLIDAHDHTAGKGVRIKSAAISIDADLPFGNFFISALGKVSFTAIAAPSSGSKALFVNSADNELYWRTNAGANVKLTSGASLNITLVGGIVGDYASVGAEVAYDDANDRYTFKQQSPKNWARIACGALRLLEFNTTESIYTEIVNDSTQAASYTITLPAALPGSTSLLQITSAGVLSFSNTVVNSIVMAASTNITLSGTGVLKHGTKTINASMHPTLCTTSAGSITSTAGQPGLSLGNNTITYYPLPSLPTYARIVNVYLWASSAADITACTMGLYATSTATPAGTTFTSLSLALTGGGTSIASTGTISQTPTASRTYWVQISNSATTPRFQAIVVDYDVP